MAKILLIDDTSDIRALVRILLRQGGHEVVEAEQGEEGLRLAREQGPDLVLTDLALPGLSGWDVVRLLKADPATAPIPVIALTAHAMRGDRERAMALGCDGFIPKPIDDEEFERTIRVHLARRADAIGTPALKVEPKPSPATGAEPLGATETRRRVLVVDDSPDVLALIRRYLQAAGFETIPATDGPSALEAADRRKPELAVLDVMLPGMDGYEVTRRLKRRADAPFLPVVLVTAGALDREHGLDVGADDFLGKPIDRVELLARVRSLLRLRDAVEEGRRQAEVLRALDQGKQRFIATVAHDLRTPLNAMGLTVQMLRMSRPTPEELDESLGVLSQNVRQMSDLLTGLLDYSRLVAGRLPVYLGAFDPRRLVAEVADSLAATAAHKGLELRQEFDDGLPPEVLSDYAKCRQVVFNLASNALKFTPDGVVTLRARPEGPEAWAIDVIDTGVGIAPEDLDSIFEEFRQARIGRPLDAPGTGLGLAICRRLVDRLGGRLGVRSEVGRGSTFTAVWPIRAAPDPDSAPESDD